MTTGNLEAAIQIQTYQGVSRTDLLQPQPFVFAAFSPTCDLLGDDDFVPNSGCSQQAITPATQFRICFSHTANAVADFYLINNTTAEANRVTLSEFANDVPANTSACIAASWSSICTAVGTTNNDNSIVNNANCEHVYSGQLILLADTGNDGRFDSGADLTASMELRLNAYNLASEGSVNASNCGPSTADKPCVYSFSLVPGDGKVLVRADGSLTQDIFANVGFPNADNHLPTRFIRFLYAPGSTASFDAGAAILAGNYQDIEVFTDAQGAFLAGDSITGLQNDTAYSFRVATVDQAGNIGYFLDPAAVPASAVGIIPRKVFGIFENSRCYIATAAYGSPLHAKLPLLRAFRDQILLKNSWGRSFTDFYYQHSPSIALWIAERPWAQQVSRWLLWPVVMLAELSLNLGGAASLGLFLLIILVSISLGIYVRPRKAL